MHLTSVSLRVLPLLYEENRTHTTMYSIIINQWPIAFMQTVLCLCGVLFFDPLHPAVPSVSLSAMRGLSEASSGLVTTMEVSGVTKLYCRDMSRAFAVAFSFSSAVPLLLQVKHPDPFQCKC